MMSQLNSTEPHSRQWLHMALLLLPLLLSQLVLQGGDRLSGPYLHQLAHDAHHDPVTAEVEYVTVSLGLLVACELTILLPSIIWWIICSGNLAKPTEPIAGLLSIGLQRGIPFALVTYFLLWWFHSVPENLPYTGFVGHKLPQFQAIAFMVGSFGAFCEEFYFRRMLLTMMQQTMRPGFAVILNAVLFALWHPNAYTNPGHMAAIIACGVFFSILMTRYRSVVPCVICHALVNVSSVFFANFRL
jgi:membrane protease YdiL (CAAX protease family)